MKFHSITSLITMLRGERAVNARRAPQEVPDLNLYYEMCQSLADAIGLIKKQCPAVFTGVDKCC